MLRLVLKVVIPLGLVLAVLLVGYNFFWGTAEEQQQSRQIIGKVKDLGGDVVDLLRTEKDKYDAGKFDEALEKISSSISLLKEKAASAADGGTELMAQLNELESQKAALESQVAKLKTPPNSDSGGDGRMMATADGSPGTAEEPWGTPVSVDEIGARIESLAAETQQASMKFQ